MIEGYIDQLDRELFVGSRQRRRILAEVGDHLHDAADALRRDGHDDREALQLAIARFGAPNEIAERFNRQACVTIARTRTFTSALAGMAIAASFVSGAASISATAQPSMSTRVTFILGAIVGQVALAAGLRLAALVIGSGEMTLTEPRQLRVVERTSKALGVTLPITALLLGVALSSAAGSDPPFVAVAGLFIVGLAAALLIRSPRAISSAMSTATGHLRWSTPSGAPERVARWIADYSLIVLPILAAVGAAIAMNHAETNFAAAVPWGIGEAIAVVAGYVTLGRTLGWRRARS